MGLPRQEYWSRLPFPPPGHLPDPRINLPSSSALTVALEVVWCPIKPLLLIVWSYSGSLPGEAVESLQSRHPVAKFWILEAGVAGVEYLDLRSKWSLTQSCECCIQFSSVAQSCPTLCNPMDCCESRECCIQPCCFIGCLILGKLLDLPWSLIQFISVTQSCPTLCNSMDCSTPGFPVHHQLPRAYSDSCPWSQWCHPTVSSSVMPSPPAVSLSQHQGLWSLICKLGIIKSQPSRALVRIRWINACTTVSTLSDTQQKCNKWWSCYNHSSFIIWKKLLGVGFNSSA